MRGDRGDAKGTRQNQVDVLVITKSYQAEFGWSCKPVQHWRLAKLPPSLRNCNGFLFRGVDLREEMVRLAEQQSAQVEVVMQKIHWRNLADRCALALSNASQPTKASMHYPNLPDKIAEFA